MFSYLSICFYHYCVLCIDLSTYSFWSIFLSIHLPIYTHLSMRPSCPIFLSFCCSFCLFFNLYVYSCIVPSFLWFYAFLNLSDTNSASVRFLLFFSMVGFERASILYSKRASILYSKRAREPKGKNARKPTQ